MTIYILLIAFTLGVGALRQKSSGVRALMKMSLGVSKKVGAQRLDWPNLGFEYRPVNSFIEIDYKNGAWGAAKAISEEYVKIHIGATALHYGQACFEGLKAFHCLDGSVRIFRR